MQTLAAYVIFLLIVAAVGLAIIFGAILIVAIGEAVAWLQTLPALRRWEQSVLNATIRARTLIDKEFTGLRGNLHVPHFHANL
ncbi:MAG TPA: hypothetical protein VG322_13470 [Candidatus Acidoferrales bacterium]|jgi:hypothetical protein|nr:hypothetical protein [Candidatus Acidoferrales bacterium]